MAQKKASKTDSIKLKCVLPTHRPNKPVLVYFCPRENKSICFISSYPASNLTQSRSSSGLVRPWQCSRERNKEALYSCAGAVKILLLGDNQVKAFKIRPVQIKQILTL